MFVDVLLEDDEVSLAKVVRENPASLTVRLFTFKKNYFHFERDLEIERDSVVGFYDLTETIESLGYEEVSKNRYNKIEDYEPSESDSDESYTASESESDSESESSLMSSAIAE